MRQGRKLWWNREINKNDLSPCEMMYERPTLTRLPNVGQPSPFRYQKYYNKKEVCKTLLWRQLSVTIFLCIESKSILTENLHEKKSIRKPVMMKETITPCNPNFIVPTNLNVPMETTVSWNIQYNWTLSYCVDLRATARKQ